MTSKVVVAEMIKYGVKTSKMQVWRAKKKALQVTEDSHFHSYGKLLKYAEFFRKCNPKSLVKMHYIRSNLLVEPRYLRLFVIFKAMNDGFTQGCKPFAGFDGCHLKGPYGDVLLTTAALD